jgi:hypothetical protein
MRCLLYRLQLEGKLFLREGECETLFYMYGPLVFRSIIGLFMIGPKAENYFGLSPDLATASACDAG